MLVDTLVQRALGSICLTREDETNMYSAFAELLLLHERTYGRLSGEQNERLAFILERRITPNSKILSDFNLRKKADKAQGILENPLHTLTRLLKCTEAVRRAAADIALYPRTRNVHRFTEGSNSVGVYSTLPRANIGEIPAVRYAAHVVDVRPSRPALPPLPALPTPWARCWCRRTGWGHSWGAWWAFRSC